MKAGFGSGSIGLGLARAVVLAGALAGSAAAAADSPGESLPSPVLRRATELTPPAVRVAPPGLLRPAGEVPPPFPSAPGTAPALREDRAIFLTADRLDGVGRSYVEGVGHAELRTRRETVVADRLRYDFNEDEIRADGNVVLRRGIDWIAGTEARFKRDLEIGYVTAARYQIGEVGGRGDATELRMAGPDLYDIADARYTTCVAPREDWYLRIGELEVDRERMVGTAHHATVFFGGLPIGYSPWIEFPLSNERKSGFLVPTLGSSGTRGFDAALPYYFNLAPNYDASLTPRLMTKRGVQLGSQFRYLFDTMSGEASAEMLPHDRITGTDRYALATRHYQQITAVDGLYGYWDLNKVSDDTYFSDLSDRIAITSQTVLGRDGGVSLNRGPWQFLARAQGFQTLQDPTAPPVTGPYFRIPQVLATLTETDLGVVPISLSGTGEYVRFRQPALTSGTRFYVQPMATWSRQGASWFIRGRAGVNLRHYAIEPADGAPIVDGSDPAAGAPQNSGSVDISVPIASLDAGLIFERDLGIFGQNFVQTFEPRAFYVNIPYRRQNQLPVFDTAIDDFNLYQLFSENRYLGFDRIGDANQLSIAVTSRILDSANGAERLRFAIGQRFYFQDQRVTLNESPRSASSSDFLVGAEGRLSDTWALNGLLQQNFDTGTTERLNFGLRYTPSPGRVLSGSYRYSSQLADTGGSQAPLKQFDLAAQWPVTSNLTLLARWNFSLADGKPLEAIAGVEYNADCWVLRLVGQRLATTSQTTTTSVYLQIELNGLARFGTSPLDVLRRSVPGYIRTNDPLLAPRDRGDLFPEF